MKKVLTFLFCAGIATMLSAQSAFVVSPQYSQNGDQLMLLGEAMSQNLKYVAGSDQAVNIPMIWNTETQDLVIIHEIDSNYYAPDTVYSETDTTYYEGRWEYVPKTGSFHAINNNGLAVGSLTGADYISYPIMANINDSGAYTILYHTNSDAGGEAYAITEDGATILGFHFDAAWVTHACVWTNNGQNRVDLPVPTTEQFGCPIDYVSARWISANGKIILGYAQDATNGSWVALAWRKVGSTYEPICFANNYFQPYTYDNNGEIVLPENPKPYFEFQPMALSYDGNMVALTVLERHNPNDWDNIPEEKVARYSIATGHFEVLNTNHEYTKLELFGIANNGTCVGRMKNMNPETFSESCDGVIWRNGAESDIVTLNELYSADSTIARRPYNALSFITSDNAHVMGYAGDIEGNQISFYTQIGEPSLGINTVDNNNNINNNIRVKGIYDLNGRKLDVLRDNQHGVFIIDGKKILR